MQRKLFFIKKDVPIGSSLTTQLAHARAISQLVTEDTSCCTLSRNRRLDSLHFQSLRAGTAFLCCVPLAPEGKLLVAAHTPEVRICATCCLTMFWTVIRYISSVDNYKKERERHNNIQLHKNDTNNPFCGNES